MEFDEGDIRIHVWWGGAQGLDENDTRIKMIVKDERVKQWQDTRTRYY